MQIITLATQKLQPGRYQPRRSISPDHVNDIALSLEAIGQQQPITVTHNKKDPNRFDIVSGEYRWQAAKQLGWDYLQAIIVDESDKNLAINAIISNGSLPLNPIEQSESYARLIDEFGLTHAEIAQACGVGKNRGFVTKSLRLLKLPKVVRESIAQGSISPSHAQILLEAPSDLIVNLAEKAIKMQWNTRRLKSEITVLKGNSLSQQIDTRTDDWIELEKMMSKAIGAAVSIKTGGRKEKPQFNVNITCASPEELNNFLMQLKRFKLAS